MSFAERFPAPAGPRPPFSADPVDPNDTVSFFAASRVATRFEAWLRAEALHMLARAVDALVAVPPDERTPEQVVALLVGMEKLENRFVGDNWLARALSGATL